MWKKVWYLMIVAAAAGSNIVGPSPAMAQIIPDGTLPQNPIVIHEGNRLRIEGGTRAGGNLFHSFREFSVPTGDSAFFNNAGSVTNIILRVTGGKISHIDGLIRANGGANIFAINPAGIVFGPNGRLDIGGSFLGSTADSIVFGAGNTFSAINPENPLLTVDIPIGLNFRENAGTIQVQGSGNSLNFNLQTLSFSRLDVPVGLEVKVGRALALVGGEVKMSGGGLIAPAGRIELGSVTDGMVSISPKTDGPLLDYAGAENLGDIDLSQAALVDASGSGAGNIQLFARRIRVSSGSAILSNTQGSFPGEGIRVSASELVEAVGEKADGRFASGFYTLVESGSSGNGGNLIISTPELRVASGAQIATDTLGSGSAGDMRVEARDVEVTGATLNGLLESGLRTEVLPSGTGNGGKLLVMASRLRLAHGGQISSVNLGPGRAGDIEVRATDIEIIGGTTRVSSGLFANSRGAGDAGSLTIKADSLRVAEGAQMSVSSVGGGSVGNVMVVADEIRLDRGLIRAETETAQSKQANITIAANDIQLRRGSEIATNATGIATGGNITINTDTLTALEDSDITANAVRGNGGQIAIATQGIFLSADSEITASSQFGIDGVVEISRPETDPDRGLITFAEEVVDPADLIGQSFCDLGKNSSFYVVGRGGVPTNPGDYLNGSNIRVSLVEPVPPGTTGDRLGPVRTEMPDRSAEIVPARGWVMLPDGRVKLVAYQTSGIILRDDLPKDSDCHSGN